MTPWPALETGEAGLLPLLAGEGVVAAEHVAIVVAHPDDETIGCGAQLPRLRGATLVHVTDGAPRRMQDGRAHGFETPVAYAATRQRELEAAMALAGIGPATLVGFGIPDQEGALQLVDLTRRLAALFEERGVTVVLTHAYEGGHPDHDAVAFAVHAACRYLSPLACCANSSVGRGAPEPTRIVLEMPFYHAGPSGWIRQRFIPDPERPELAIWLSDDQKALKARMMAVHGTQAATLAAFTVDFERFRAAPAYDFAVLPNGGDLLYERYDWGTTGPRWQAVVRKALAELRPERAA